MSDADVSPAEVIGSHGALPQPTGLQVSGRCPGARLRHATIGAFFYLPLAALVSARLVFDGADTHNRWGTMLLVMGAFLAVVVVAGAVIDVHADGDGLHVRNRWRRATVRWSDIERVELRRSRAYWVFDLWMLWNWWQDPSVAGEPHFSQSRWLVVRRRGRRRRLPIGATLGIMTSADQVAPFVEELGRRGHAIDGLLPS